MRLRALELKDASLMLEWMHNQNVVEHLSANFSDKNLEDCIAFIEDSFTESDSIHRAIVSDEDEYMGTVSLKRINREEGNAEFAIAVRESAMGRGYSWYGMVEMIKYAFEELALKSVYWCVSAKNGRACHFYDKHGFRRVVDVSEDILAHYKEHEDLIWYSVLAGDDFENVAFKKGTIAGCPIIRIQTIPTINAGELSFFETNQDVPFEIKRLYYISKVPEGVRRGFHAHKELKQVLFCPYGKIQLVLDDGVNREEITLSDPSVGVIITKPVWREMLWLQKDSVLCVAASDYYDVEDYIRNYDAFLRYIGNNV